MRKETKCEIHNLSPVLKILNNKYNDGSDIQEILNGNQFDLCNLKFHKTTPPEQKVGVESIKSIIKKILRDSRNKYYNVALVPFSKRNIDFSAIKYLSDRIELHTSGFNNDANYETALNQSNDSLSCTSRQKEYPPCESDSIVDDVHFNDEMDITMDCLCSDIQSKSKDDTIFHETLEDINTDEGMYDLESESRSHSGGEYDSYSSSSFVSDESGDGD